MLDAAVGPHRDASGRVRGVVGAAVDATLGAQERERFAAFAAFAPAAAFVRDAEGRYLWVNEAYAHLYRTPSASIVGRTIEEVDPDTDVPQFRSLDQEVLTRGRPLRHSLTFVRADGTPGRALGHRFPLDTEDGRCVGGVYVDVTDYVRALDERTAALEDLHALRDRSGAASVTFTLGGRIERASPGAAALLATTVTALEGSHVRDHVVHAHETEPALRAWRSLVEGRTQRRRVLVRCRTGGGRRTVRADLAVVRAGGRPSRLLALVTALGVEHDSAVKLTPVQEEVLVRLACGEANTGIGAALGLSRQALDYHLRGLRRALDAPSRPAAVARAYALGLLDSTVWPPVLTTAAPDTGASRRS